MFRKYGGYLTETNQEDFFQRIRIKNHLEPFNLEVSISLKILLGFRAASSLMIEMVLEQVFGLAFIMIGTGLVLGSVMFLGEVAARQRYYNVGS